MASPTVSQREKARLLTCLFEAAQGNPRKVVSLGPIAGDAGLSPEQARLAVVHFEHQQWAPMEGHTFDGDIHIKITPAGVAEVERLRTPWWKRWLVDRAIVAAVVAAVVSAILTAVLTVFFTELAKRMFSP
jgi:hypothetical protein